MAEAFLIKILLTPTAACCDESSHLSSLNDWEAKQGQSLA